MRRSAVLSVALLVAFAVPQLGCVAVPVEDLPDWLVPDDAETIDLGEAGGGPAEAWADGRDGRGREMPYGTHGRGAEVLMMGRSVTAGWFDHWGWDGRDGVTTRGYRLYFGELAPPPNIAASAVDYVSRVPSTTVVFFGLDFADFPADSADDIDATLAENVRYSERVVSAADDRGIVLVLGNALPQTIARSDSQLVDVHVRYNAALEDMAATSERVFVFDQHDVLTNQQGALYKGFAVSPGDAHLNDVAYLELDDAFFEFLDSEVAGSLPAPE